MILQGFIERAYIEFNKNFDKLSTRLKDTEVNKEIPLEVIVKINECFTEWEEEMIKQFLEVDTSESVPEEVRRVNEKDNAYKCDDIIVD